MAPSFEALGHSAPNWAEKMAPSFPAISQPGNERLTESRQPFWFLQKMAPSFEAVGQLRPIPIAAREPLSPTVPKPKIGAIGQLPTRLTA
jgi:hypothetical protein